MSYSLLWSKVNITKVEVANYLHKYWHLLKWKNYKENILEIGCASGAITKEVLYPSVRKHTEKLLAVDKLEDRINFAKIKNGIQNIEFQTVDIMDEKKVRMMEHQFDHIFSFYCAQWIMDQRSFIEGLFKMLKPGGQILLTTFPNNAIMQSFRTELWEEKWWKYLPKNRVFPDYTENPAQYFTNLLKSVGFKVDLCEHEKKKTIVEPFEDLVTAVISLYEYLDLLPPNLKEEYFRKHIRNVAEASTYLGPDKYDFPYETMICICSKNI